VCADTVAIREKLGHLELFAAAEFYVNEYGVFVCLSLKALGLADARRYIDTAMCL